MPTKTEIGTQPELQPAVEPTAPRPLLSMNALVRGVDVEVRNALTGVVIAGDDVELERGIARSVFAGGGAEIHRAGAGIIVAGGDTSLRQGGAQAIVSAGSVTMEQSGSGFAIARRIRIGPSGTALLALTPRLEVQDGGRVIFGRSASLAIVGGVAAIVVTLVTLLRQRARTDGVARRR